MKIQLYISLPLSRSLFTVFMCFTLITTTMWIIQWWRLIRGMWLWLENYVPAFVHIIVCIESLICLACQDKCSLVFNCRLQLILTKPYSSILTPLMLSYTSNHLQRNSTTLFPPKILQLKNVSRDSIIIYVFITLTCISNYNHTIILRYRTLLPLFCVKSISINNITTNRGDILCWPMC